MIEYYKDNDSYVLTDNHWTILPEYFKINYKLEPNLHLINVDFFLKKIKDFKIDNSSYLSGETIACKNESDAIKMKDHLNSLIIMSRLEGHS